MDSRYIELGDVSSEVKDLQSIVHRHPAVEILNDFEKEFEKQPLSEEQLRVLLSSEGCFILEVPPGIVALASRITDEYFTHSPFESTGIAARILYAAVDEYGLSEVESGLLPSHHELYAKMASHWDISQAELTAQQNIVPKAASFAAVVSEFYRNRPIAQALGFHVASETTAPLDFGMMNRVFSKFRVEYRLEEGDPFLDFLRIHDVVEESHAMVGLQMVELYSGDHHDVLAEARAGVDAFMNSYGEMFSELGDRLFG